jgi:hypothetical protein
MPYKERYERDKEKYKEYYEQNKTKKLELATKYYDDRKQHAYDSISSGEIIDRHKWDMWCDTIKRYAKNHPYSDDFTNDIMFSMLILGCWYCGDAATAIDRIYSKLYHTPDNCVGSCHG